MITRIWHGATPAAKSDEYLNLKQTVAIPDYRSTPGNRGAYALRRIAGDTAHFLMITFWESEEADPCLRWRRHQGDKILPLRQGFPGSKWSPAQPITTRMTGNASPQSNAIAYFSLTSTTSTIASLTTKSAPKISLLYRASQSGR